MQFGIPNSSFSIPHSSFLPSCCARIWPTPPNLTFGGAKRESVMRCTRIPRRKLALVRAERLAGSAARCRLARRPNSLLDDGGCK